MTLVEFLDRDPMENLASCLSAPNIEKVIFVGRRAVIEMRRDIYRRFLADRGITKALAWREIDPNDIRDILACLSNIVEREDACCFDLTGGEDLALAALGALRQRLDGGKAIQMHRIDLRSGTIYDVDGDGQTIPLTLPQLTVEEFITLQGGVFCPAEQTIPFHDDMWPMWEVFRQDPIRWNQALFHLTHMEGRTETDDLSRNWTHTQLRETLGSVEAETNLRWLVGALVKSGVLLGRGGAEGVRFAYKSQWAKQVMEKAGNILELVISALAQQARDADGKPYYSDAERGTIIDWNGAGEDGDVQNEIDLTLIRTYTPIFLSCKGGAVNMEELYKLDAVSRRFGGAYAKKVLVIAGYAKMSDIARRQLQARAHELHIHIIDNVHRMSREALAKSLSRLDQV